MEFHLFHLYDCPIQHLVNNSTHGQKPLGLASQIHICHFSVFNASNYFYLVMEIGLPGPTQTVIWHYWGWSKKSLGWSQEMKVMT